MLQYSLECFKSFWTPVAVALVEMRIGAAKRVAYDRTGIINEESFIYSRVKFLQLFLPKSTLRERGFVEASETSRARIAHRSPNHAAKVTTFVREGLNVQKSSRVFRTG